MITLTGEITWQFQREAAARAVRYLTGVTGMHNTLGIKPIASAVGIKAAISGALTRDHVVRPRTGGSHGQDQRE